MGRLVLEEGGVMVLSLISLKGLFLASLLAPLLALGLVREGLFDDDGAAKRCGSCSEKALGAETLSLLSLPSSSSIGPPPCSENPPSPPPLLCMTSSICSRIAERGWVGSEQHVQVRQLGE